MKKKCLSIFKGAAAIALHFAHGGLLAVGVMVSVFVCVRVADAGLTPRMLPVLPELTLLANTGSGPEALPASFDTPLEHEGGARLTAQQKQVVENLSRRFRVADAAVSQYVTYAYAAAEQYRIDPLLIIALISVESAFNPTAESIWGAQGLTQVIPRFHPEKLALFGPSASLLDPKVSIFVGAQVLREYIRATGSVEGGLQRYVGSIEDPDQIYSNKVLNEHRRLLALVSAHTQTAELAI